MNVTIEKVIVVEGVSYVKFKVGDVGIITKKAPGELDITVGDVVIVGRDQLIFPATHQCRRGEYLDQYLIRPLMENEVVTIRAVK